jgi:hypothetical protein
MPCIRTYTPTAATRENAMAVVQRADSGTCDARHKSKKRVAMMNALPAPEE